MEQKKKIYKNKTGLEYDSRTRQEVYNDLKKVNDDVSLSIYSITDPETGFSALSGKSLSKTIMCNENGYYPIIVSDRYGFNNPDYEWNKKTQDILIIGTPAYGVCVTDQRYCFVIRKKKEVLFSGLTSERPKRIVIKEYSTQKLIWSDGFIMREMI